MSLVLNNVFDVFDRKKHFDGPGSAQGGPWACRWCTYAPVARPTPSELGDTILSRRDTQPELTGIPPPEFRGGGSGGDGDGIPPKNYEKMMKNRFFDFSFFCSDMFPRMSELCFGMFKHCKSYFRMVFHHQWWNTILITLLRCLNILKHSSDIIGNIIIIWTKKRKVKKSFFFHHFSSFFVGNSIPVPSPDSKFREPRTPCGWIRWWNIMLKTLLWCLNTPKHSSDILGNIICEQKTTKSQKSFFMIF